MILQEGERIEASMVWHNQGFFITSFGRILHGRYNGNVFVWQEIARLDP